MMTMAATMVDPFPPDPDTAELAAAVNTVSAKVFCFDGDVTLPVARRLRRQQQQQLSGTTTTRRGTTSGGEEGRGGAGGGGVGVHDVCLWEMRARVPLSARETLVRIFDRCDFPGTWLLHSERADDWYTVLCRWSGRPTTETPSSTPLPPVCYHRLDVQLVGDSRFAWRNQTCAFDIDLLGRDARSLYLLDDARLLRNKAAHRGDPFSYVARRIMSRRFCLLRAGFNCDDGLAARMTRAYDLVAYGGWRMDVANGVTAWLLCPWWLLCHPSDVVRLMFGVPPGMRVAIDGGGVDNDVVSDTNNNNDNDNNNDGQTTTVRRRMCAVCPLCHEAFAAADVVARLCCGHVFHCRCRGGSGGPNIGAKDGLLRWIEQGRADCPMCRAAIHG